MVLQMLELWQGTGAQSWDVIKKEEHRSWLTFHRIVTWEAPGSPFG
jgi:hypothetical protein